MNLGLIGLDDDWKELYIKTATVAGLLVSEIPRAAHATMRDMMRCIEINRDDYSDKLEMLGGTGVEWAMFLGHLRANLLHRNQVISFNDKKLTFYPKETP